MVTTTASQGSIRPSRRTRVVISCTECHRRKQKCDRNLPCNQCLARNVQSLCQYTVTLPDSSRSSSTKRSSQIRSKDKFSSPPVTTSTSSSSDVGTPNSREFRGFEMHNTRSENSIVSNSFSNSSSDNEQAHERANDSSVDDSSSEIEIQDDEDVDDVLGYFKTGVANIAQDIAELKLSSKFISTLIQNSDESKTTKIAARNKKIVARILRTMPPRPYAELLVKVYFSDADFYQSLNQIEFWESMEKWWALEDRAENIVVPTLMFRLMSIALQYLPEEHVNTISQIDTSLQSLWRDYSQSACDLAALLPDCVEKVLEHLLYASWLKSESRMKESWYVVATAIRMAQEIRLHVEVPGTPPSYDRERRRRLWWTAYHWDRCMGLILGRPTMIADEVCSVPVPLDLPDSCYYPVIKPPPPVTDFTGRHLVFKLSRYISDLDANPKMLYTNLSIFTASLPSYFSIYAPDKSLDDQYPFLVVHRESLATTICMILCALYRRKVPIPNPLSFCLRLLTAAERLLSLSKESQYRQFMNVYINLEPSMLICREILKLSGKLHDKDYIVCDDGRGHVIDIWQSLDAVEGGLARLKIVRSKNRMAVKAYAILKELLRRVKIQVDREKRQREHADSAIVQDENVDGNSIARFSWTLDADSLQIDPAQQEEDQAMAEDELMTENSIRGIMQEFDSENIKPSLTPSFPEGVTSVPPHLICGKVAITMPAPPSIISESNIENSRLEEAQCWAGTLTNDGGTAFAWNEIFPDNLESFAIGEQMEFGTYGFA